MNVSSTRLATRTKTIRHGWVPVMLMGMLAVTACTEAAAPTIPTGATPSVHRQFTYTDSLEHGLFQAPPQSPVVSADAACDAGGCPRLVSAVPGFFQGATQPEPIAFTFAGPVHSVTVTGRGAISCDGTWGTLTGFDSSGSAIGAVDLHLIDRADCSPASNPDNVTFGATGTLTTTAVMARAVLTPMSLLAFPVFDEIGHASQTYTVTVGGLTQPPRLAVACPAEVGRGTDIDCTISVSDAALAFTITDLTATVVTRSVETLHLPVPGMIEAGQVYHLKGPAVTPTTLTVSASVTVNGRPLVLTETAQFRIDPRPAELEDYIMRLRPELSGPGNTTPYPTFGGGSLGLYQALSPDWRDVEIATAGSGPNAGLSYVKSIPGIPASLIYLTFALFPGDPWYEAHPVRPGQLNDLGLPICTQGKIDELRLEVERHEGVTLADNSHYGIDQQALRLWQFNRLFGGFVVNLQGSPESVRQQMGLQMAIEWEKEQTYVDGLQTAFDATDTPGSMNALGCSIFLKI